MTVPLLRSLHLRRFRSLPSATVEFDNPTFLVGENGTGKSNVADAFTFLAEAMASPLPAVFERRGGIEAVGYRSSPRGRPSSLEMRVVLENLDEATSRATYEFKLRSLRHYDFEVVQERCVVEGRDNSRNFLVRDGMVFRSSMSLFDPVLKANALALPLAGGDRRFEMILRFLSEMCVYRIESAVLREIQNSDAGSRLRTDGSNAASVLRKIERESPDDWQTIHELLRSIVPGTIGVDPKRHGDKLSLEFAQQWPESRSMRFKAYSMSDGTLRALGLLAAVFQRPAPSVLVIEEPEATMHPGALGTILDVLRHASRFMQVVVTTHSPDILDAKWIEDRHLRIVGWKTGSTYVSTVSDTSRGVLRDRLMGAGELMRSNALTAAEPTTVDPS